MRKTLIVACLLATTAVMPALAAGEMSKKVTADAYTELQTTITQYIDSTTVDTETFEDGAVVNITPLLDQINGAFTGHEYTSEDRDASNKKRPAYVTEDQFKEIAKTLDSQLKGFSGGGAVNVGIVRQAVTTTLTQAQTSTQMSNANEVRASERAAIKAYVAAMKASGQTLKMSAGGALAWGPSHGYPIVAPKYYTGAQLNARFVGTAKTTTSGGTGSTGTGTTGPSTGNTGTVGTGTGTGTGTVGTGTGTGTGTVGTGTGTGTAGTGTGTGMGTGSSGTGTGVGSGTGTGTAGNGSGSTGAGTTQGGTLVLPNPTDLGTAIGNTGGTGTGTTGTSTGGSTGAPVTTGMSSNGTSTNTPDGAVPGGLTTDPSRTTPNNTPTNVVTVVEPQPTPTTTTQTPIDPTLNPTLLSPGQELGANDVPRNVGQSVGNALNAAAAAMQ